MNILRKYNRRDIMREENTMTRQEAKTSALSRDCSCVAGKDRDNNFNEIIDKVFDYFESKTCSTCKYFNQRGDSRGICFKKGSNIYKQSFHMQFGCNLHEYKECK